MDQLSTHVVAAAILSFLIQQLKKSRHFPFITTETAKINRIAAVLLSGLATLGIHVVCNKANHSCNISWSDGMTTLGFAWQWFTQFCITHGWYKAVDKS